MTKCPSYKIDIPEDRKIVGTDELKFPWKQDKKGYFLVKIENGLICVGHVDNNHKMSIEFRGKDPDKIIKEIAKRELCSLDHMGYVASEIMIAKDCLENNKKYVQK